MCGHCGNTKERSEVGLCNHCSEVKRDKKIKYREKCREDGKCTNCGNITTGYLCNECKQLKQERQKKYVSRRNLKRAAKKLNCDWKDLKDLFDKQNGTCVYSGKEIIIGKNAHLDHIVPRARGGGNELTNLQWLHKDVNMMKRALSESDFLDLVECIHRTMKRE